MTPSNTTTPGPQNSHPFILANPATPTFEVWAGTAFPVADPSPPLLVLGVLCTVELRLVPSVFSVLELKLAETDASEALAAAAVISAHKFSVLVDSSSPEKKSVGIAC